MGPIDDIAIAIASTHPTPETLSRDAVGLIPRIEDAVKASRNTGNQIDIPLGKRFPVAESQMATRQFTVIKRFQLITGNASMHLAPTSHNVA